MQTEKKFKVYSTISIPNELTKMFENYKDKIEFEMSSSIITERKNLLNKIIDYDALFCSPYDRIDSELLETAKKLKFISTFSVGFEHINLEECFSRNIRITTTPYFDAGALAEFTIGMMLNISRNITTAINTIKGVNWFPLRKDLYWLSGVGIKDSVVGIFGLGTIGMGVAKRLKSFEVKKIIYHNRKNNVEGDKLGFEYVSFDELLKQSDFIVCSCSINKESEKVFNKIAFEKMKSNAIFVNVSRGIAVDQNDLYDALKNNKIMAAGLDVTTPQPLEADDKLYKLPNCFVTPHIAWSESATTNQRITHSLRNVISFYKNRDLINEIKQNS